MQPLAERLRPTTLETYIGQQHLVGEKAILRKAIDNQNRNKTRCLVLLKKALLR